MSMSNSDEKGKIDLEDLEKSFDELNLLGKFCTMQMLDVYLLLKYQIFMCILDCMDTKYSLWNKYIFSFMFAMIEECVSTCTSTPVKPRPTCRRSILDDINTFSDASEISKKHELTPESKASGLPARKRITGKILKNIN